jgi:hypothetical protein
MNSIKGLHSSTENNRCVVPALPPVSYKTIALKELAFPPELFDEQTPSSPLEPLDALTPILAAKSDAQGRLVIVDGCKRLQGMLEKKQERCAGGVFQGRLDAKSIGLLRIYLNKKRPLSIRERVCFYKWLIKNCEGDGWEVILDSLGFDAAIRLEVEPLLACADNVLDAVHEGRLSVRLAPDFCLLDKQGQAAFLEVFKDVGLSLQTQREFLEWLPEIAFATKTTIADILRSSDIQKIMNDKILNSPQKIEAIRTRLHACKFPLYDATLTKWKKLAAATSRSALENEPSSKVVFVSSPAFEMNKLEIRITINHAPAAKEIFQKLSEVPQTTWSRLIYPV